LRREGIPFRGPRTYCPRCHTRFEEKFLLGFQAISVVFGLIGFVCLWRNSSSTIGHVYLNVFLIQLVFWPSIIVHEFAHAIAGKLSGLNVPRIWIGRGKTLFQSKILGFNTEFKMIPVGGLTFLTHGLNARLRLKYFVALLAGPLSNAIILAIAWRFTSWRNFDFEASVPLGAFIVFAQSLILLENLLPYRIQTAVGRLCTDGLSLFQLVAVKSPDILNSRIGIQTHIANPATQTSTWTA
jgi:hypothetical protein